MVLLLALNQVAREGISSCSEGLPDLKQGGGNKMRKKFLSNVRFVFYIFYTQDLEDMNK